MKKILKYTGILLLVVFTGLVCFAFYFKNSKPAIAAAEIITVDKSADRVAHGKYLANSVAVCMDCHSQRDFSVYAAPLVPETFASGGQEFGKNEGFPGTIFSRNITPYSLSGWTDGEIFRAITTGVSKDGTALFPLMPYRNYGKLDREDINSIIAYLRTLPSIKSDIPAKQLDFPLNFLLNTMPAEAQLTTRPDTSNMVSYGQYLITAASCMECHSREEKGALIAGTEYGGGRKFGQPNGSVWSANITPDKETGIGSWDKTTFINRFKVYADTGYTKVKLNQDDLNTPMPWFMYASMTEKDLGAIYDYLRTVKPIQNKVTKFQKKND